MALVGLSLSVQGKADSREDLKKWIGAGERPRLTPETYVFSRAQFKFGLSVDDYYNRYVDRPLFPDREKESDFQQYRQAVELAMRYKLSGLAFFPQNTGCDVAYRFSGEDHTQGFHLLTEFMPRGDEARKIALAGKALQTPSSLRINGKVVLSSYVASTRPPEYWKELMAKIRQTHGDHFLFLPSIVNFGNIPVATWLKKFNSGAITERDIRKVKEHLRSWLRATDGLYFSEVTILRDADRRFDLPFYRDFIIPNMKAVLAEPEFKDKIFGLAAKVGHENHTRMGRTLDSNGTKTLRQTLQAALEAKPEIINIPEWDELNESTCVMPTIYDGMTSMRIIRHCLAAARGEALSPLPGDDVSIPNFIVSYRKMLALGEKLEIELLHVPDSAENETWRATLQLKDRDGKTIHSFPEIAIQSGQSMKEHTFVVPTEALAPHCVVQPSLELRKEGKTFHFEEGLHYAEIRPTGHWDYKWVKQPLRDILQKEAATVEVSPVSPQRGTALVKASFSAPEPLAFVELLEDDYPFYSHSESAWHESADQVIISLIWKSARVFGDSQFLDGAISLEGAAGRWSIPAQKNGAGGTQALDGQTLSLKGMAANFGTGKESSRILIAIAREEIDRATLDIRLPEFCTGKVPVREIMERGFVALPGPGSFTLVLSRFLHQRDLPRHLKTSHVEFSAPYLPERPGSIVHLQAIAESGRIYRSRPIVVAPRTSRESHGLVTLNVFSDTAGKAIPVKVRAADLPDLNYTFDPKQRALLVTDAGRPFWGVLGGYVSMTTMRGGSAADGAPFLRNEMPSREEMTAPKWVQGENGEHELEFDGKTTYITLPQGAIPRRAGYEVSMEIRPDEIAGRSCIFSNTTSRFGTLSIFIDEGAIKATFLHDLRQARSPGQSANREIDTGMRLEQGKWSKLIIQYDQEKLRIAVNGEASQPLPLPGPGMHDTVTAIGGRNGEWFAGRLKSLSIRYARESRLLK